MKRKQYNVSFPIIIAQFVRDCDKEAFGVATAQGRIWHTRVCRVSSQAKGKIHRLLYVIHSAKLFLSCYAVL